MKKSIVLAGFLGMTAIVGSAHADEPATAAERLFQEARALVEAKNYAAACPKLEESAKLEPAVGTQFNLADCYEHVGRVASAWLLFGQVASIARAAGKFEREKNAKGRAAALEPRLPRLLIVVGSSAPGLEILLDDKPIDREAWPNAFPVDPGPHRVRAKAPGRTPWEASIVEEEGMHSEVDVPELVDPSPKSVVTAPPPAPPARSSTQRTIALAVGGVGMAGLAVGAVAGVIALSDRSDAERLCASATYHFHCPNDEGASAWNGARTAGNVSTIGFIVGGVAVAAAAVLWITAPSPRARVGVTPNGLRFEGSL